MSEKIVSERDIKEFCSKYDKKVLGSFEETEIDKNKKKEFKDRVVYNKIDRLVAKNYYVVEYGVSRNEFWIPRKKNSHTIKGLR